MRTSRLAVLVLWIMSTAWLFAEPMCGTGPETDRRLRAARERVAERVGLTDSSADSRRGTLRDGSFYLQNDEWITSGYRPLDLVGQSLIFTPSSAATFRVRRESSLYVEPAGAPRASFQGAVSPEERVVSHDLPFALPLFGRNITRIYVTAFNAIHLDPPPDQTALHFDVVESAVHRGAVLSPLMITTRKPRQLEYPRVYVEETADTVFVTWRSTANAPFGYDVQAAVKNDGSIIYSYRSVTAMRWGTPVLSPGFDPETVPRTLLHSYSDMANDVPSSIPATLRPMLDIRKVETLRLHDSELFAVRLTLAAAPDSAMLGPDDVLAFQVQLGASLAEVEIDRQNVRVRGFAGSQLETGGASAQIQGNVVEFYGSQIRPSVASETGYIVRTLFRPLNRIADTSVTGVLFPSAPRTITTDFSSLAQETEMRLPVAEAFLLGDFDPFEVWDVLRPSWGLSAYDYDAVAMYQTFFTDLIFFAGAYATGGNPQVDGIRSSFGFGTKALRAPTLLHMNQLSYNYSAEEETASKVLLHEFGHRWLYFFRLVENGRAGYVLNPVSAHPAAFVHTPSAFPVYGSDESSVMGGGTFRELPDGTYQAHAANMGYSWTDLYLMGLAAPEEVPSWFYLAGTELPLAYWPPEGAVVAGERRGVHLSQVIEAEGPRVPSAALSPKTFRILFVLVTEEGVDATEAEVAKLNQLKSVMERNFALATGGRGRLITDVTRMSKKRGAR